jgi:hypothetical protein
MYRRFVAFALLLLVRSTPSVQAATPPSCNGAAAALTQNYAWFVGSAQFVSGGEPESGSSYRWLTNGGTLASGPVAEDLLLHFDNSPTGANGETPALVQSPAYAAGKWGSCLALPGAGKLQFSRNELHLDEGTVELWVALRADGTNAVYAARDHVLFQYRAPNGDFMQIAQAGASRILYAGGTVSNQWESAYGSLGDMSSWRSGQWHHLALTYSAPQSVMRFYVDGALAAQNNEGHYWPPNGSGTVFSIGGDLSGNAAAYYWVDELRLSARAAEAAEIAARAARNSVPQPNEVWLAVTNVTPNCQVVFEFTPASVTQTGAVCRSAALTWSGIPITNAQPSSTLLPPGATNLFLAVQTIENTACAWSVGQPLPFAQMTPFASGAGTRQHSATVAGLDPNPNLLNDVYVRCAAHPDYLLHLQYRALSDPHPPYPRTGNLWGWGEWIGKGLPHMSKVDLWLGASPPPDNIVTLRQLNPHLRLLTSINAVENSGLPNDYYLKDVHGNRVEVWPGSYRLNLTKSYVADYQARYAYQTVLDTGLMADGVFFDNVMTSQSWQTHDIYGNPVQLDANEDGIPDDPATLDATWKAGVFREIQTFRQLMPNAVVCGHSMDIYEPGISALFNGISVGFWTSDVLENRMPFSTLLSRYNDWLSRAVSPTATMIESSPMAQISYGYDYSPDQKIPSSTLEFARTFYPYVRFGLAFTLMNDGFFAHEFGDTWHGNDWWYDELNFNLGYPLGPAQLVSLAAPAGTNVIVNGDFETSIDPPWQLWVNTGCAANLTRQATNAASGAACVRAEVTQTTGTEWHIDFAQWNRSLTQGVTYNLTFFARAATNRNITLSSQKGAPDWRNYGLYQRVALTTNWQPYTVTFTATETVSDARIQFFLGESIGTVWLDNVQLTQAPSQVYRRDFNNGVALLNATRTSQNVSVGPGFHRLTGNQAPMYECILDDQGTNFTTIGAWTNLAYDSGLWKASGPFYHSWAGSLHERSDTTGEARWQVPVVEDDTYTISAWWPAGPRASNWSTNCTYQVVSGGVIIASTNLDQTTGGDQWHDIATVPLSRTNPVLVRVSAPSGTCVADALHIHSQSRFNNGLPVVTVQLQPMDGIILQRDQRVLNRPGFGAVGVLPGMVTFAVTNLTPSITWNLERATNSPVGPWQTIQAFQPFGFEARLADPNGQSLACFYRLRTN